MNIDFQTLVLTFLIGFALHILLNRVFIEGLYDPGTGEGINPECPPYDHNTCHEGKEYRCFNTDVNAIACDKDFDWCNKQKFMWCGEDYGLTYDSEYLFDDEKLDEDTNSVFTSYLKDIYVDNRDKIWMDNVSPRSISYPSPIPVPHISITINTTSGIKTLNLDRLFYRGRLILTSSDILEKYTMKEIYNFDGVPPEIISNSIEFNTTDSDCIGGSLFINPKDINIFCPIEKIDIRDYTIYGVDNSQDKTYSLKIDYGYTPPRYNGTNFWANPGTAYGPDFVKDGLDHGLYPRTNDPDIMSLLERTRISYADGLEGISIQYID